MLFRDIIGHDKIKHHLVETYQSGRTAHAQIFVGNEGSGSLALALAYAQYLQCENPSAVDACGTCAACHKMNKLIHPDVHFVYPTIGTGKVSTDYIKEWREILLQNPYPSLSQWLLKMNAENQQGNINKNECVEIVRKFSLRQVEGRNKILILWLPEYLGKEGNRLLKLIEEPEPNTVFLLIAENAEKILNTILSRCQLVQIPRLSDNDLIQYLIHKQEIPSAKATTVAYLAEGNINKALQLAETMDNTNAQRWCEWLALCQENNGSKWVSWVDSTLNAAEKWGRKEQTLFLQYGLHFLRELLAFKVHKDPAKLRVTEHEQPFIQKFLYLKFGHIQQIMQHVDNAMFFIERNAAPKPLFLNMSIEINRIIKQ